MRLLFGAGLLTLDLIAAIRELDLLLDPGLCCKMFMSRSSWTSWTAVGVGSGSALTSRKVGYVFVIISRAGPY